jgi:hypothetical protein
MWFAIDYPEGAAFVTWHPESATHVADWSGASLVA